MMKKTLIALALAATAVSGSAMAWTSSGTGGSVEFSGTLTPEGSGTPWEVLVGAAVSNLNADIKTGATIVDIPVTTAIPVMGIRTAVKEAFAGKPGIRPQIDYKGAIDASKFAAGVTTLTLDVKDTSNAKIGVLTAPLSAAAVTSWTGVGNPGQYSQYASSNSRAYWGGLSTTDNGAAQGASAAKALVNSINPDFMANYVTQEANESANILGTDFSVAGNTYSSAYGAGIVAGAKVKLTLDTPAARNAIAWSASLPITVSYQ